MTWTDIGPTQTAAQALVEVMASFEQRRENCRANGDPATADNLGHVIDRLWDARQWMLASDALPTDRPPKDEFREWLASIRG